MGAATTNTISLFRAASIGEDHPPLMTINAHEQISEAPSLSAAKDLHNRQGVALADALLRSLPGGTIDVLLIELMRRRASLLAVPLVVRNGD